MSLPISRKAFEDCYYLFERALASPNGVQKLCATQGEAEHLRLRLNKARALDIRLNTQMYVGEPDHPNYASSIYYQISIKIVEDQARGLWLCRLEKIKPSILDIEEIPDGNSSSDSSSNVSSGDIGVNSSDSNNAQVGIKNDFEFEEPGGDLGTSKGGTLRNRRF